MLYISPLNPNLDYVLLQRVIILYIFKKAPPFYQVDVVSNLFSLFFIESYLKEVKRVNAIKNCP